MNQKRNTFIHQTFISSSLPPSYKIPRQYVDCGQLLNIKLHGATGNSQPQLSTQQKQKYKKKFFIDQTIEPFKNTPSPNKYLERYSTHKRYKSQNTFITNPKESQKKLGKRPTWIEDIEKYQQKYQPPAAGKYNLLTQTDFSFPQRKISLQKLITNRLKFNNFDDAIFVSAHIPGPGTHNPHKSIQKLKINPMNMNSWKKIQIDKDIRIKKKINLSNTSSCSYSPIKDKTFDLIRKQPKKESTLMKIITIDKRKGKISQLKSPGPGSHNILNQWATQTFQRQNSIGNLNLFSKTTRSLPSWRVYN